MFWYLLDGSNWQKWLLTKVPNLILNYQILNKKKLFFTDSDGHNITKFIDIQMTANALLLKLNIMKT